MNKDDLFGSTQARFDDLPPITLSAPRERFMHMGREITDRGMIEVYSQHGYPIAIMDSGKA